MKKHDISRVVYLAILLPWMTLISHAQGHDVASYSFLIKDKENKSIIPNAIIHTISAEGKIIGYKLSNQKGVAELSIDREKTHKFRFSLIGYDTLELSIDMLKEGTTNEVFLKFSNHQLQEITVIVPPIKQKGDTIVYNAGSFVGIEDNYLDDLLRKLPGITVSTTGAISYQGKPISKFYIEGQDLLGTRYNQITQNLAVDAVSNVEVMENHQHIKMLKGKVFEDKTALNIRLKEKFKLRPVGDISIGAGAAPLLWNAALFGTQISKRHQLLVTGKTNNCGDDLAYSVLDLSSHGTLNNYQLSPMPFLSIMDIGLSLNKERWLKNEAYSFGTNYLYTINDNSNLKLNTSGYFDKHLKSDYNSLNINGTFPIVIDEDKNIKTTWREFVPTLTYEHNSTDSYILDELKYKNARTKQKEIIISQNNEVNQDLTDSHQSIENSLKSTFEIMETLIDLNSFTRYLWREETLQTHGGKIDQEYLSSNFVTNNSLSTQLINTANHKLFLAGQVNYEKNHFESLSEATVSHSKLKLNPEYSYSYQNGYISFSLPIGWNSDRLNFIERPENDYRQRYLTASPSLYFKNKFNQWWTLTSKVSYRKSTYTAGFYTFEPLMRNYRTQYESPTSLSTTKSFNGGIRVEYKNLLRLFFANFSASFTLNDMNQIWDYTYQEKLTKVRLLSDRPNQRRTYIANISLDKSITKYKCSIKGNITYSGIQYVISQNSVLTDNLSNTINYSTTFNWQALKWLHILYTFDGSSFWQNNAKYDAEIRSMFSNKLKFFFSITTNLQISARYDYYTNQIEPERYVHNHFFDADLKYAASKRLEFTLKFNNLFNNDFYEVYNQTGLNTSYYRLPLREREFLAAIKWKF